MPIATCISSLVLWVFWAVIGVPQAVQPVAPRPSDLSSLNYDVPFFPNSNHDPAIPTPDSVLGFPGGVGSRPANHAQIEAVIKAIAAKSPRTRLFEYGKTHEGRTLYYLAISSEANIKKLDQIKADLAKFADPRSISAADGDHLADTLPAAAWMAYCIHGDEMSGSDAALALAYHLAASTDEPVRKMLDELVVLIDPLMNPDGRDRCLRSVAENRTAQPNVDDQSLIHSGSWPHGRMNHYLFDMNRDWIYGTQPETRGRIEACGAWHPHYFMESHEMGSQDTFLFMPAREPVNPNVPPNVRKWETLFAKDQAGAFDAMGWRYYNGEWNEDWYPGYSGSWGALRGAVDNLYEQAGIVSDAVRRPEGTLQTYREAVHHQLVSSLANLQTLQVNRKAVLKDYLAERRSNVAADAPFARRLFAVVPSANASRLREFQDLMKLQGFEMHSAGKAFVASGKDRLGREEKDKSFPPGTLLIPNRQPEAKLLAAMMEFDPHMTPEFLNDERRELLRFDRSKLYDITAWNITMMFDLDSYELTGLSTDLPEGATLVSKLPEATGGLENPQAKMAFVIDGADDHSVAAAGRLMERGVWVRIADKPFKFDGKDFTRGSVVIALVDNRNFPGKLDETLEQVANELNVHVIGINSGLGEGDLPDIGGEHFILLQPPHIAVLGRDPFNPYSYGETWYLIDHELGVRASYLDSNESGIDGADLRRYNVLVIPDGGGDYLKDKFETLKTWVRGGGTLIAIGSSASAIADESAKLSSARLLKDVVTKLDEYRQAIVREWEARTQTVDPDAIWKQSAPAKVNYPWMISEAGVGGGTDDKPGDDELKRRDAWRAIFAPQGAMLAGRVDDRSWLTAGCGEFVPVQYGGGTILMAAGSVAAPVRMGVFIPQTAPVPATTPATTAPASQPADPNAKADETSAPTGWTLAPPGFELRLRMSGLLWPEAADRLANSAYVTRERVGAGQIILFASSPTFRAATLGTTRIMSNALICGPGMGASQPIVP